MGDLVTIEMQDGVADVRLNRPDKMNALSPEMFKAIADAGESLMDDLSLRAVVLSGNGRCFCAGLDMATFASMGERSDRGDGGDRAGGGFSKTPGDRPGNAAQNTAYVWKRLPVPVIAAVHGVALGAGCQIALGADLRIATPDARFSVMEVKWGLIPDVAITQTLRDLVPMDVAKDLVFTGRIVEGEEARSLGLVTALDDSPLEAALERARMIATKSPDAIRSGKRLLEQTWHEADPGATLSLEEALQRELIGSPNQLEAVQSNFEKRAPKYRDPS